VNPSPHHARLAKKRTRKPGNLAALTRVLWRAVLEAQEIMDHADGDEMKLRAIHAISQTSSSYAKLLEIGEFEARLNALEETQARRNGHVPK
jgi:hypothetical protein